MFTTFRNSLTEDEKREFQAYPDSVSMLASVKQVFENHPLRRSRLGRLFQKLGDLAGRLTPYFETVNTLVSSNPQYAALVWGTLRFLFTVSELSGLDRKVHTLTAHSARSTIRWVH